MAIITPWNRCDMCEDYICAVHGNLHVHECDCPPIENWAEYDLYPYEKCSAVDVKIMLEETKGWEDEAA